MKKTICALLALVMVFAMTACGRSGGSASTTAAAKPDAEGSGTPGKKIGVFYYNSTNTAAYPIMEGMIDVIKEHGDEYIYVCADDSNDNEQIQQCMDELIARDDIDGIVFSNINDTLLTDSLKTAKQKGIAVASMDILFNDNESDPLLVSQTLDDNYQGGYDCAKAIIEALGGEANILILGYRGNNACRDRSAGYDDAVAEYPNSKVLYELDITTVDDISNATEDLLSKYPECNAIFGIADSVAVAGLAACKAQGRNDILICTQDGGSDVQTFIANGDIFCAACQPLYEMGRNTVDSLYKYWNGEEQEYYYNYDIPIITQENVQKTIDQFAGFTYEWLK